MSTEEEKYMQYEATSSSWLMSEIYNLFPKLFIKKCQRKYKRYQQFKQMEKEIYDKTGEYLQKYFTKH